MLRPWRRLFADKFPRRTMLVTLDLVRALVAITLPFVTQIWEIYILIFILQAASAAFTPTFQATIPDILPDEREYTRALSLSRLAYDLESVISPMLAAALLTVMSFHNLFAGTAVGFLASAALVVSVTLPKMKALTVKRSIYDKTTRGMRIFLKTPRLRGLLALNMAVAASECNGYRQHRRSGSGGLWFLTAVYRYCAGLLRRGVHGIGPGSPQTPRQHERPYADACRYGAFSHWPGVRHFPERITSRWLCSGHCWGWAIHFLRHRVVACCAVRQQRKTDRRCLPPSLHCHIHAGW
ncbi:H+ Antiporter protein [Klebsiella pneumoniae]|nr:H+ Antiporter protein [Klebsiella pneumoniae]